MVSDGEQFGGILIVAKQHPRWLYHEDDTTIEGAIKGHSELQDRVETSLEF